MEPFHDWVRRKTRNSVTARPLFFSTVPERSVLPESPQSRGKAYRREAQLRSGSLHTSFFSHSAPSVPMQGGYPIALHGANTQCHCFGVLNAFLRVPMAFLFKKQQEKLVKFQNWPRETHACHFQLWLLRNKCLFFISKYSISSGRYWRNKRTSRCSVEKSRLVVQKDWVDWLLQGSRCS